MSTNFSTINAALSIPHISTYFPAITRAHDTAGRESIISTLKLTHTSTVHTAIASAEWAAHAPAPAVTNCCTFNSACGSALDTANITTI